MSSAADETSLAPPAAGGDGRRPAAGAPRLAFKPVFVLASSLVFLMILIKYGRLPFFRSHLAQYFEGDPDIDLYAHYYLAGASVLTRLVLPALCIRLVLRERLGDYGYRLRGTGGLGRIYLVLLLIMVPVLLIASQSEAFLAKYPQYKGAGQDWEHLIIYEMSYFFVFLSGESFWRGYIVFGLRSTFGYYGILIMAIPYVIIHFGKPVPEALGALITACLLGYLALKHRSFWLGVALHFSVALGMDLLALWRTGQLPQSF